MTQDLVTNLIELRKRLIYIILGIIVVFLCLFHFANDLYIILAKPLLAVTPLASKLIATDVTSPFIIPIKLTLICAFVASLPNTLYQIWQFLAPAMFKPEKRMLLITIICVIVLFSLGIIFCYFLIFPTFFKFIGSFKSSSIAIMTDITKYFDFVLNLFFIFGLAFETPILVFLLIYFNLVSYNKFKKARPYIFVASFMIAAILTPPDVLSQIMLAIPLYLLYELGMIFSIFIKHKPQLKENNINDI
ncbi:MAG: twin-arginine translocase subunit TatC [Neisseriaceae bacterium]